MTHRSMFAAVLAIRRSYTRGVSSTSRFKSSSAVTTPLQSFTRSSTRLGPGRSVHGDQGGENGRLQPDDAHDHSDVSLDEINLEFGEVRFGR